MQLWIALNRGSHRKYHYFRYFCRIEPKVKAFLTGVTFGNTLKSVTCTRPLVSDDGFSILYNFDSTKSAWFGYINCHKFCCIMREDRLSSFSIHSLYCKVPKCFQPSKNELIHAKLGIVAKITASADLNNSIRSWYQKHLLLKNYVLTFWGEFAQRNAKNHENQKCKFGHLDYTLFDCR